MQEKNLQDKCDAILAKLKLNLESKYGYANYKNAQSFITTASISLPNKGRLNRKNLSSRLSMYNMDVKISKSNQKRRNYIRRKSIRKLLKVSYYLIFVILNIL